MELICEVVWSIFKIGSGSGVCCCWGYLVNCLFIIIRIVWD